MGEYEKEIAAASAVDVCVCVPQKTPQTDGQVQARRPSSDVPGV